MYIGATHSTRLRTLISRKQIPKPAEAAADLRAQTSQRDGVSKRSMGAGALQIEALESGGVAGLLEDGALEVTQIESCKCI